MKDNYTFPTILDYNESGFINIFFPTLDNAATCVGEFEDFIGAAQDFLALTISGYESEKRDLPDLTLENIALGDNQKLVFINVWMPYHQTKIKECYVKKTLTIPKWLDMLARQVNLNFSATLVKGIKQELHLE